MAMTGLDGVKESRKKLIINKKREGYFPSLFLLR